MLTLLLVMMAVIAAQLFWLVCWPLLAVPPSLLLLRPLCYARRRSSFLPFRLCCCVCSQMAPSSMTLNMRRVHAWLDTEEVLGMSEEQDKRVLASLEPRMVKLTGFDAHGNIVQHASGFLYSTEAALIITCSHVRYYSLPHEHPSQLEVARFRARYAIDSTEEDVVVVTTPNPGMDLMLLSGTRPAASNFLAALVAKGDTAYVAGYPPESTELCYSKGMVGLATHLSFTVDADVDNGWSGGPVANKRGHLVGVMQQGLGSTIKRPDAINVSRLHEFVCMHNHIGLRAA